MLYVHCISRVSAFEYINCIFPPYKVVKSSRMLQHLMRKRPALDTTELSLPSPRNFAGLHTQSHPLISAVEYGTV